MGTLASSSIARGGLEGRQALPLKYLVASTHSFTQEAFLSLPHLQQGHVCHHTLACPVNRAPVLTSAQHC
jgi:hypothetical protein